MLGCIDEKTEDKNWKQNHSIVALYKSPYIGLLSQTIISKDLRSPECEIIGGPARY